VFAQLQFAVAAAEAHLPVRERPGRDTNEPLLSRAVPAEPAPIRDHRPSAVEPELQDEQASVDVGRREPREVRRDHEQRADRAQAVRGSSQAADVMTG
jgi:hypothetical protein